MAFANFSLQDLPAPLLWTLFVLWLSSVTFLVVRYIVDIGRAAIIYQAIRILHYCYYQRDSTEFITSILSAQLEFKSFILLLCLLFAIQHSIKGITTTLSENALEPCKTTLADCSDCRELRIKSYIGSYSQKRSHHSCE